MEPIRKIRRGHRGNRGRTGANKAGGEAEYESLLEAQFYYLLQFDPEVERFIPQPLRLSYSAPGGKKKTYVPDTLVYYTGDTSPCLFEVKYIDALRRDAAEYRVKFRAARHYARERGWRFSTVHERSIRGNKLHNVTFLRAFLDPDREHAPDDLSFLLSGVQLPTTPRAILGHLPRERQGVLLPTLWYLVATRQIRTALDVKITMDSRIWRPDPLTSPGEAP